MATFTNDSVSEAFRRLDSASERLENALMDMIYQSVKTKIFQPNEYVRIYTVAYELCSEYDKHMQLYEYSGSRVQAFLCDRILPIINEQLERQRQSKQVNDSEIHINFLTVIQRCWESFVMLQKWHGKFFAYVNRVIDTDTTLSIEEVASRCYRVFIYDMIHPDMTKSILFLLSAERNGYYVDKSIIKSMIQMYLLMGQVREKVVPPPSRGPSSRSRPNGTANSNVDTSTASFDLYREHFEVQYLSETKDYYVLKRCDWLSALSISDYFKMTESSYDNERIRILEYGLPNATEFNVLPILDEELLRQALDIIFVQEKQRCYYLFENDKNDDIQRMFALFRKLEDDIGVTPIAGTVSQVIRDLGQRLLDQRQHRLDNGAKEKNSDNQFVSSLIELNTKYTNMVQSIFDNHLLLCKALHDSFVFLLDQTIGTYHNNELLVSYCDYHLRSAGKVGGISESNVIDVLDQVVALFQYVVDKDFFGELYKYSLSKRLMNNITTTDIEKHMVGRLKVQCGPQYTSRMEAMFADFAFSLEENNKFRNEINSRQSNSYTPTGSALTSLLRDFDVRLLTTGFWPTYHQSDLSNIPIPSQMSYCMDTFTAWHQNAHQKRKLQWALSQGSASINGTFSSNNNKSKLYIIQVTTLQAIVLLLFNDGIVLSYDEISQRLNIPDYILKPLLASLSCAKERIIKKSTKSNKILSTDTFQADKNFKSQNRKIKMPIVSYDQNTSYDACKQKVDENRTIVVEASIVRIMKARKVMTHNALVAAVHQQLCSIFIPGLKFIKLRIESLIDREYMERGDSDNNTYQYKA